MAAASTQSPKSTLATFNDILAIPEDQRRHEVLDGELTPKAMAGGEHGTCHLKVSSWVQLYFGNRPNGADRPGGWHFTLETEIELSPHQVVRPDIAGWRRERMPQPPSGYPLRLRPDWVCEVMADGDARRRDGMQKRRIYADALVPYYWLVDTERQTLTVLRLEPRGYVEILNAPRTQRVRAEPFDSVELLVGSLFGDGTD